ERVHLAVEHDAPALHAPIVSAPEDSAPMHEHGPDGDPALGQPALGLLDRRSEKLVHARPPVFESIARGQLAQSDVRRRGHSARSGDRPRASSNARSEDKMSRYLRNRPPILCGRPASIAGADMVRSRQGPKIYG